MNLIFQNRAMSNLKYQRRVIQILLVKIIVREFNDNILPAFSIQGAGSGVTPDPAPQA